MKRAFSERLSELFIESQLTQFNVAIRANIGQCAVNHYLHGNRLPGAEALLGLCYAFNCSADYLLGLEEEPITAALDLSPAQQQLIQYCVRGFSLKRAAELMGEQERWAWHEMAKLRGAFKCDSNYQLFYKLGGIGYAEKN